MGNCGCWGESRQESKLDPKDFQEELGTKPAPVTPLKHLEMLGMDDTRVSTARKSGKELESPANDSSFFSSQFQPAWENSNAADFVEINGIPWSKLKVLRRDPAFNKQEFLAALSKDDK